MMRTSPRGVSLIEGLVATLVLLTGMVGVLQGLAIASVQNSMANRQTRASVIAQELIASLEQQGRARLLAGSTGLFSGSNCTATPSTGALPFVGELRPVPPSLTAQGFNTATTCYVDLDALPGFASLTPGYGADDNFIYTRVVAVFRHPTNTEVLYVGVNVGWRDAGRVRIAKRFTALYDTTVNQTNLEY